MLLQVLRVWTVCLVLADLGHTWSRNDIEDDCIWEGRGFRPEDKPYVLNVQAGCSAGELIWRHPYGGVRAVFHPRDIKGPFRLCFVSKSPDVRISSEGLESMKLLQSPGNEAKRKICIKSVKEHSALYIESENKDATTMRLKYTVHPLRKSGHRTPRGCKPCDLARMMDIVCKSDFVVKGNIESTFAVSDSEDTQATVVSKFLLKQNRKVFMKTSAANPSYKASIRIPKGCNWKKRKNKVYWIAGDVVPGKGAVMTCFLREEKWSKSLERLFKRLCKKSGT
ncbi:predicted protein [Nematostella vectensis]|uniref:Meteorin-like protein n=1 Tax=Nematostella vectensis TaxID=45351 RepID=A7SE52_NEMVE|nr:predicted protein [Nematostella vectensis]|eukprot:XP_001630090.1 predicted protein [Nematostella vectensis]